MSLASPENRRLPSRSAREGRRFCGPKPGALFVVHGRVLYTNFPGGQCRLGVRGSEGTHRLRPRGTCPSSRRRVLRSTPADRRGRGRRPAPVGGRHARRPGLSAARHRVVSLEITRDYGGHQMARRSRWRTGGAKRRSSTTAPMAGNVASHVVLKRIAHRPSAGVCARPSGDESSAWRRS